MIKKFQFNGENVLSYNDFGNENGFPILIQHGTMASIKDIGYFEILSKFARVIFIARPGYGESTPYILKNLLEYGNIIHKFIEELDIKKFDVLGSSAGAIYAYTIAKACPEKIRNIFVYSGTPALYDEEVRKIWPYTISEEMTVEDSQKVAFEVFFSNIPENQKVCDYIKDSMANNYFGEGQNLRIRFKDWGFTLSEIEAKVYMQHSKGDNVLPYTMAVRTVELMKNCELELLEAGEHFTGEGFESFIKNTVIKKM